jgi:hypothetical protein
VELCAKSKPIITEARAPFMALGFIKLQKTIFDLLTIHICCSTQFSCLIAYRPSTRRTHAESL